MEAPTVPKLVRLLGFIEDYSGKVVARPRFSRQKTRIKPPPEVSCRMKLCQQRFAPRQSDRLKPMLCKRHFADSFATEALLVWGAVTAGEPTLYWYSLLSNRLAANESRLPIATCSRLFAAGGDAIQQACIRTARTVCAPRCF